MFVKAIIKVVISSKICYSYSKQFFFLMTIYPKIKFKIDLRVDTKNAVDFIKYNRSKQYKHFALWFLPEELRYILDKKISVSEKNKIIKDYTKKTYKDEKEEIAVGAKKVEDDWLRIEEKYFGLVDKIFKGYSWPRGNYRGYISIFKMYPRYVDSKIFFFPYKHRIPKYSNKVIAHEMLHFIFFDYINKRYSLREKSKIKNRPDNFVWQVSEVFNNVMENWEPYNKVIKDKGQPYPGTEEIYELMSKQWLERQDVDWLLDKWLKV